MNTHKAKASISNVNVTKKWKLLYKKLMPNLSKRFREFENYRKKILKLKNELNSFKG
jgi:hypothetical protein